MMRMSQRLWKTPEIENALAFLNAQLRESEKSQLPMETEQPKPSNENIRRRP